MAHDGLHQGLSFFVLILIGNLDVKLLHEGSGLLLLEVHDGIEHLEDGVQDELVETTDESFTSDLVPLLGLGVVELVSPETLHELEWLDLELAGVDLSELFDGEGPVVQTGTEANGSLGWVDHHVSHWGGLVTVGGNNDVDVLNNTLESLQQRMWVENGNI